MSAQAVVDMMHKMIAAGATPEAMVIAAESIAAIENDRLARRAAAAARKRRQREREEAEKRDSHAHALGQSRDNPGQSQDKPLPPDAPQGKVPPTPPSKPNPPLIPPAPASSSAGARRDLETELRTMMVTEPIVVATDFREIAKLLEEPGITEADAIEGVRAAMAEQSFRPKYWRQLVGWIRGAAKQRLANGEKGRPPVSASTEPRVELGAGISWPVSSVERAVAAWRSNSGSWPYSALGPQPGSPGCRVPARFLTAEVA